MSGCALCVYDLYDDALAAYSDACRAARDELRARGVSVSESVWPVELRGKDITEDGPNGGMPVKRVDPVRAAFEQMERELMARRAKENEAEKGAATGTSKEGTQRPRPEPGIVTGALGKAHQSFHFHFVY